ncbi:MAG: hypothetical protein JXL97_13845 [Bacteroidales bacterium]|nr:hypothetical protein [Bacteroidales bacterium]
MRFNFFLVILLVSLNSYAQFYGNRYSQEVPYYPYITGFQAAKGAYLYGFWTYTTPEFDTNYVQENKINECYVVRKYGYTSFLNDDNIDVTNATDTINFIAFDNKGRIAHELVYEGVLENKISKSYLYIYFEDKTIFIYYSGDVILLLKDKKAIGYKYNIDEIYSKFSPNYKVDFLVELKKVINNIKDTLNWNKDMFNYLGSLISGKYCIIDTLNNGKIISFANYYNKSSNIFAFTKVNEDDKPVHIFIKDYDDMQEKITTIDFEYDRKGRTTKIFYNYYTVYLGRDWLKENQIKGLITGVNKLPVTSYRYDMQYSKNNYKVFCNDTLFFEREIKGNKIIETKYYKYDQNFGETATYYKSILIFESRKRKIPIKRIYYTDGDFSNYRFEFLPFKCNILVDEYIYK